MPPRGACCARRSCRETGVNAPDPDHAPHAPVLLTPGPLTTAVSVRAAMQADLGSWDDTFRTLTADVCATLVDVVHGAGTYACVPMQGSGSFAVEAALGTLVPREGRMLVPSNGAYCERMLQTLEVLGRSATRLAFDEREPIDPDRVDAALLADPSITHVGLVHCETGTGILNPLDAVAEVVARRGRRLIVDAMSTFGALPIDLRGLPAEAIVGASGKCLEGVPGMGFVIAPETSLACARGRSHSLALDLHDQWRHLRATGRWRYTPPTHVVAALDEALRLWRAEGGRAARLARYRRNCTTLVAGLRRLGFETLLADEVQAPIIVTVHAPADRRWRFDAFYRRVRDRGFVLYPGKLTRLDTFRVGCIGAIGLPEIEAAVDAIAGALHEMGVDPTSDRSRSAHAFQAAR